MAKRLTGRTGFRSKGPGFVFSQYASFPNVLGCIDGTHVRIQRTRGRISIGKVTPALMCKLFVTMKVIILIIKLFAAFFFSVLSVRTFVYVDSLPLILSVRQFDPIPIRPIDDTIVSIEM